MTRNELPPPRCDMLRCAVMERRRRESGTLENAKLKSHLHNSYHLATPQNPDPLCNRRTQRTQRRGTSTSTSTDFCDMLLRCGGNNGTPRDTLCCAVAKQAAPQNPRTAVHHPPHRGQKIASVVIGRQRLNTLSLMVVVQLPASTAQRTNLRQHLAQLRVTASQCP